MNRLRSLGFTLIELLVVMAMAGVMIPALVSIYILPLRVHANLTMLTGTTVSLARAQQHLSEDIRCADEISVETLPEGGQRLFIKTPSETVRYEAGSDGFLVRNVEGTIPLTFPFKNTRAQFALDTGGRYKVLKTRLSVGYDMLRTRVEQTVERTYCSHLEGQP